MKKLGTIVFLILVFGICLTPLAWMLADGPSPALANEILSSKPVLIDRNGSFNVEFLTDACDYFADHFGGRQQLITANATLEANLLHESASEKVVLGTDGWLYYASTLEDYQGSAPMTERELFMASRHLALMEEYAAACGARFLFTVAPNKNTLYPAHMPERYMPSETMSNLDRLAAQLAQNGTTYLDLKVALSAESAVLYHKTDSHWNNLGAALAHDAILSALERAGEKRYAPEQYTAEETHVGDLYRMLYPTGTAKELQYTPNWQWQFTYSKPLGSVEDQRIETADEQQSGNLLLFRDSFGNTLYPFLAESFGTACISRANPYDLTLLEETGADTLVIELVERNLRWLTQRPAVMPAPVREIALSQQQTQIQATASGKLSGGMYCLTGEISQEMDPNSCIYVLADGVTYEATPAGSTEGAFAAYLPEEPQQIQLIFVRGGTAVLSQPIERNS